VEEKMPKNTFLNLPSEKQEKVIREAIKEFAYKGYEKGNVGEIAKNSNVAKGSMYQYFEDKKDLYIFAVKKAAEISIGDIENTCNAFKAMDIYDYIYKGFKAAWPLLKNERDIFVLLRNVSFQSDIEIKNELSKIMLKSSEDIFLQIIEENKVKGFIRKDIDNRLILLYIDGISFKFKSYMLETATNEGKDILDTDFLEFEKLIIDMIDLIKNGISN
jgi:AcrR family transcriptional regulator